MNEQRQLPDPQTPAGQALRQQVSPERWTRIVEKAQVQASIVNTVRLRCTGQSMSQGQALRQVSPGTPWPTFQYWCRRVEDTGEVSWEDLLDRRIPPRPKKIPESVQKSAALLRRVSPDIGYEEARGHLVAEYGKTGGISDSSLLRIWQSAGLQQETLVVEQEVVEEVQGGAGLALISAAADETGAMVALAKAAQAEALRTVDRLDKMNLKVPAEPAGRGEGGRLTKEYNESVRAGVERGQPDARWAPDYVKRQLRELGRLQVLEHRIHTVALKLLTIGLIPLITARRGFDGLDGPFGAWFVVLGGVAYMPATLDKFLAQLAFLDVEDALWAAHAAWSHELAVRWGSAEECPAWLRLVIYIDASQDPHWTYKYAKSGKVSRTGRIGPCLCRVTITSGPGVPLLMETYPGTMSLKTELPRLLERVDDLIGEGELGRITVVVMDAEMATPKLLYALKSDAKRTFITVLKGANMAKNFTPTSDQDWQSYRERDELREGTMVLHGQSVPKEGFELRTVEMRRPGRHTHSTFFGTNAAMNSMTTEQVVDAYLSRWPHQEQLFRNARNGLGLERSHGYGGELVQHVAYDTKKEETERRCLRAEEKKRVAHATLQTAEKLAGKAKKSDKVAAAELCKVAKAGTRAAEAALQDARKELAAIETTPREIYERDAARENVVTSLTMTVVALIEYVLREYFGGLHIEFRTFIEYFVNLPVTMVTSDAEILYRVHVSTRNPERAEQVRKACEEVTRRGVRRGGKTLVFQVAEPKRKPLTVRLI